MKKILVIVDMQVDFVNGSLGSKAAESIVPNVVKKIENFDGDEIISTFDTHGGKYLDTMEGKKLPVKHCIMGTNGWCQAKEVMDALEKIPENKKAKFMKKTFGSEALCAHLKDIYWANDNNIEIEFAGLCTNICLVTNVLATKMFCPEAKIVVDASCCAGTTEENHVAAIKTMKSCHIDILNFEEKCKLK